MANEQPAGDHHELQQNRLPAAVIWAAQLLTDPEETSFTNRLSLDLYSESQTYTMIDRFRQTGGARIEIGAIEGAQLPVDRPTMERLFRMTDWVRYFPGPYRVAKFDGIKKCYPVWLYRDEEAIGTFFVFMPQGSIRYREQGRVPDIPGVTTTRAQARHYGRPMVSFIEMPANGSEEEVLTAAATHVAAACLSLVAIEDHILHKREATVRPHEEALFHALGSALSALELGWSFQEYRASMDGSMVPTIQPRDMISHRSSSSGRPFYYVDRETYDSLRYEELPFRQPTFASFWRGDGSWLAK